MASGTTEITRIDVPGYDRRRSRGWRACEQFCIDLVETALCQFGVPPDPGFPRVDTVAVCGVTLQCVLDEMAHHDRRRYNELLDRVCNHLIDQCAAGTITDAQMGLAVWLTDLAWLEHDALVLYDQSRPWAWTSSASNIQIARATLSLLRFAYTLTDDPEAVASAVTGRTSMAKADQ